MVWSLVKTVKTKAIRLDLSEKKEWINTIFYILIVVDKVAEFTDGPAKLSLTVCFTDFNLENGYFY